MNDRNVSAREALLRRLQRGRERLVSAADVELVEAYRAELATEWTAHVYLSTSCLHGRHGYCADTNGAVGPKTPAQCKFCATPCICTCHERQQS